MIHNGMEFDTYFKNYPDKDGFFGKYGGAYITEELKAAMDEITEAYFTICKSAKFISELGVKYVEVLPYNKLAGSKYATVLRSYEPDFDDRKEINLGKDIFDRYSIVSQKM